jgi:uncharacterized protein (TIGR00251 family)
LAQNRELPARPSEKGLMLQVRLTPKSSSDEVSGVEETASGLALKARVRAVPDKGKANDALIKLLAGWLGWPQSRLSLASGGKSRIKQVFAEGDPAALEAKLKALLADAKA